MGSVEESSGAEEPGSKADRVLQALGPVQNPGIGRRQDVRGG